VNANNCDISSTGFTCHLDVYCDVSDSQRLFKEEMHVHQHDGYRTTAVYEFGMIEGGHIECVRELFGFSDDITQKEYRRALFDHYMDGASYYGGPSARDFFSQYGIGNVDWKGIFMDEVEDGDSDHTITEWAKEGTLPLISELLSCQVKDLYRTRVSCGYCQGDYAIVIIPNLHGWDGEHRAIIDSYVDHLCWDCPSSGRLTITDNETGEEDEIYLDEMMDDPYEWDKDEVLTKLKSRSDPLSDSVIDWLEENLPDQPDYI